MGQVVSSPSQPPAGSADSRTSRRITFWRRPSVVPTSNSHVTVLPASPIRRPNSRARPVSVSRLEQLIDQTISGHNASTTRTEPSRSFRDRLQRSRHSAYLSNTSNNSLASPSESASSRPVSRRSRSRDAPSTNVDLPLPTSTSTPDITLSEDASHADLDLDFTASTSAHATGPTTQHPASRRSSLRVPQAIQDRFPSLRSGRQSTSSSAALRRRRSPLVPGEDNTALLSRLLSVAAAATAATLLEGSEHTMAEARGVASDGDDGSFDGFLQSLESGRLASALRQGTQPAQDDTPGASQTPLNFFRMFRFGSTAARNIAGNTQQGRNGDNRMVPIIIVGIRAVQPGAQPAGSEDGGVPPFLDALSTLPTTPFNTDNLNMSDRARSRNGSRFSSHHRRRASFNGASHFPAGYDSQRHHRSPDRARPQSVASELASWPRPPPATPASPSLSRVASTNNTPAPTVPTSRRSSFSGTPRRESIIRTTTTTTLETTSEDTPVRSRSVRPRRGSDVEQQSSNYSTRRNGIVEPDGAARSSENTRSWIIYVLGGSYPENHPILTTPSLFTDSPTYEDMMLLSTLLGPAKPPVASNTDVASAGGIYKIEVGINHKGCDGLVAIPVELGERVQLAEEERCLVCLCDFEKGEEARKLTSCGHLFHRECIDEWLTKGRNSCPLCRGQGVHEQKKEAPPVDSTAPSPVIPSEPASAMA